MNAPALFVVGSSVQLDNAQRVIAHLQRPASYLDIWRGVVVGSVALSGHLAPVTLQRLRAVASAVSMWARQYPGGIIVVPQDVGLVYRRVIAAGRQAGARIVLLPDGAVSDAKVTGRRLFGGVVPMADAVLRGVGFAAGRHGEMGASQPDLALSWGPAWNPVFERRGAVRVVATGSPRSDDLVEVGPPVAGRVLVCSQPMDHAAIGGAPAARVWYDFLEQLAATAPAKALAIRLHPAEAEAFERLPLGRATKAALTAGSTLVADLAWAGGVVSWASTTMLEAAGAGRPVVSLAVNPAAAELARGYYFQRDPRVVARLTSEVASFAALDALVETARTQQAELADEYLVNIGSATKTTAAVLDSF